MDRKQTMSNVIFSELFIFFNGLISSFNRLIVLISAHAQHMLSTWPTSVRWVLLSWSSAKSWNWYCGAREFWAGPLLRPPGHCPISSIRCGVHPKHWIEWFLIIWNEDSLTGTSDCREFYGQLSTSILWWAFIGRHAKGIQMMIKRKQGQEEHELVRRDPSSNLCCLRHRTCTIDPQHSLI